MDGMRWAEIKTLLAEVLALEDTQARCALLDERCDGDETLRAEVEAFLSYEEKTEIFLEVPALDLLEGASPERREGEHLGPYRLEGVLAHGGMGVVHRASRVDGTYRQQVAVKVLKRGLDTAEIVRRFHRERQILANLSHPHVVRVLDGGATTDGLPYYVMEYVEGLPIDRYCEERGLDLKARLALFRQVCLAAHSAHQELVVHCDLKPSNVLVVADGTPRLVDFGIARLLRSEGETTLLPTGPQPVTWGYASPEQVAGQKPTTASDIYSLGALLYRLLTGVSPPRTAPETGLRPSRAPLGKTALPEGLERKRLQGDPDAIVRKATAPDPGERYASAAELAEDVERYLEHRPLRARRAGVLYPVGRFLQRHRRQSLVAAGVLGVLVYFGAQWQTSLLQSSALRSFALNLLEAVDPTSLRSGPEAAQEALEKAEAAPIQMRDEDVSLLLDRIGRMSWRMGELETAQDLLERSLALRRRMGAEALVGESLNNLALVYLDLGDVTRAYALLDEALEIQRRVGTPGAYLDTLESRATALERKGDFATAERFYRQAVAGKEKTFGPESEEYANALNNLGNLLAKGGKLDEAIPMLGEALKIRRRELGPNHDKVATTLTNFAYAQDQGGDPAAAIPLYQEALAIRRQLLGEDTLGVAGVELVLAYTLLGRAEGNDLQEAERLLRHAEAVFTDRLGAEKADTQVVRRHLAATLLAQGRPAEALEITQSVRDAEPDWLDWRRADLESIHGAALAEVGRFAEAEPLLVGAVPRIVEGQGEDSRYTREARARLERLRRLRASGG